MDAHDPLRLELLSARPGARSWDDVLGAAVFGPDPPGAHAPLDHPAHVPLAEVPMAALGGARAMIERWRLGGPIRPGSHGMVHYAHTEEFLFGRVHAGEDDGGAGRTGLERATERAYRQVHATLETTGFPHLLRVWNYIADITLETHGTERYRQFNSARQEALISCGRSVRGNVPAASALGSSRGPLAIYFLAGRAAPQLIENPRQVSAYHYPAQYGPRAPSFSRAALVRQGGALLLISGTSSILGHRTMHEGDPAAQTRETLANIEALLQEANRFEAGVFALDSLIYKVYVRDPGDLPVIRAELDSVVGAAAERVYLRADICRRDLSVEIEAVGQRT